MDKSLVRATPFLVLLVAWQVGVQTGKLDSTFFSSPLELVQALADWYGSDRILPHLGWTAAEIIAGMLLSIVIGVPVGILTGWYRPCGQLAAPVLYLLDAIPIMAVAPVLPLVFGVGPWTAVILVFFLTIVPTVVSVSTGVRTVPPDLLRMGRHFGADDRTLFRSVVLPYIVPYITGAMRGNVGRAYAGVLVGEWLGSNIGLGSMMFDAAGVFEVRTVYVAAATVVAMSLLTTSVIHQVDRRLSKWKPS